MDEWVRLFDEMRLLLDFCAMGLNGVVDMTTNIQGKDYRYFRLHPLHFGIYIKFSSSKTLRFGSIGAERCIIINKINPRFAPTAITNSQRKL